MRWPAAEGSSLMPALKQIVSVTLMNIKSVPQRLGASSVIVIGIAGVVGVLVSILAMVAGLSQMMSSTERATGPSS